MHKKMVKYFKDGLLRLKFLAKISALLPEFIAGRLSQALKVLPETDKKIFFTFDDEKLYAMGDGNSRYIYLIMNRFSEAGYNVYFYRNIDLKTYYRLEVLGRLIFKIKNLKILTQLPADTSNVIYAFDKVDKGFLQRKWKGLVYVNTFKPPFCQVGNLAWIPYFMFSYVYTTRQHKLLGFYRENDRKVKMIFAGNASKTYYNNPKLRNRYGQLTRIEGINALLELGSKVKCKGGREEFEDILNLKDYANECRIVLTDASFPIKFTDWFKLISKSDFFVCLSGTDLPMCHNVIEAMAVGTIPIISYPDWFFPPLEHKRNAIVYSGREDLHKKIKEVLEMPIEQISTMRKNVIEYYERHLTTESFIQKFESQNGGISTIMLHPRLVCAEPEEEQGRKLHSELQSMLSSKDFQGMQK